MSLPAPTPPPPRPRPLLTVDDVASICHVSKMTIHREIRRGNLHAYRIGRSLRIDLGELRRYLNEAANPYPEP